MLDKDECALLIVKPSMYEPVKGDGMSFYGESELPLNIPYH